MTKPPQPSAADYAGQVRDYLAYCGQAAREMEARHSHLDPKYHPSADGAAKVISHGGDGARADAIRQAFADLTGEVTGPAAEHPAAGT